jgi:hypothetical protein
MTELPKAPLPKHLKKADEPLVTEERRAALRLLAAEEIQKEEREREEEKLLDAFKKEERGKLIPEEAIHQVTIDLAPCGGDHIRINGEIFMHGFTYSVPKTQLDTILEIQARTYRHEYELMDKHTKEYSRHRSFNIGPQGAVTTANLLRV